MKITLKYGNNELYDKINVFLIELNDDRFELTKLITNDIDIFIDSIKELDTDYITWINNNDIHYDNFLSVLYSKNSDFSYSSYDLIQFKTNKKIGRLYKNKDDLIGNYLEIKAFLWKSDFFDKLFYYNLTTEFIFLYLILLTFDKSKNIKYIPISTLKSNIMNNVFTKYSSSKYKTIYKSYQIKRIKKKLLRKIEIINNINQNKKIALLLFGISYMKTYNHWNKNDYSINYQNSTDNYEKFIFKFFKNSDFDVFISTYNNEKVDDLINYYKPKKYHLENDFNINFNTSRNRHFINSIKLCLEYSEANNINYQFVIITRFDLEFLIEFDKIFIDKRRINIVSELAHQNVISDNFYIIPFYKLIKFYNVCISNKHKSFHFIKEDILTKVGQINYMHNQPGCEIHQLELYNIVRNKIE